MGTAQAAAELLEEDDGRFGRAEEHDKVDVRDVDALVEHVNAEKDLQVAGAKAAERCGPLHAEFALLAADDGCGPDAAGIEVPGHINGVFAGGTEADCATACIFAVVAEDQVVAVRIADIGAVEVAEIVVAIYNAQVGVVRLVVDTVIVRERFIVSPPPFCVMISPVLVLITYHPWRMTMKRGIAAILIASCLFYSAPASVHAADILSNLSDVAQNALDSASDAVSDVKDSASDKIGDVRDSAFNLAGSVKDSPSDLAGKASDTFVGLAGKAGDAAAIVKDSLAKAGMSLKVSANDLKDATADTFDDLTESMSDTMDEVIDSVSDAKDIVIDSAGEIRDFAVDAKDAASENASEAIEFINDQGSEITEIAQKALEGVDLSDKRNIGNAKNLVLDAIEVAYKKGMLENPLNMDHGTLEVVASLVVAQSLYGYEYKHDIITLGEYASSMSEIIIREGVPCGVGFLADKLPLPGLGHLAKQATFYLIAKAYD